VAKDVNGSTLKGFGARHSDLKAATVERMKLLVKRQKAHAETLQNIEDDLEAYSNRIQEGKFKTVLAEMRDIEAIKQVHAVADRMVANEPGTSIAHSEFLADTFDRWAEQLVGPG
jgi:aryl-alcohol dehydrogenase-like predicted oxidoreductase